MAGSDIKKNSPTVAKNPSGSQSQLKVNGSNELVVSVSNIGNGATSFQTPQSESITPNPVLATASLQDSANTGAASLIDRGILMMGNSVDNDSYRILKSTRLDALTTATLIIPQYVLTSFSTGATPHQSYVNAIVQFNTDAGPTDRTNIISITCNPINAAFTSFETVITYTGVF